MMIDKLPDAPIPYCYMDTRQPNTVCDIVNSQKPPEQMPSLEQTQSLERINASCCSNEWSWVFSNKDKILIKINYDGRVELDPSIKPDVAAKCFWNALQTTRGLDVLFPEVRKDCGQ